MRIHVISGPEQAGPFALVPGENVVGRSTDCVVGLPSKRVSRRHAVLRFVNGEVWLEDAGSANGVLDTAGRRIDGARLQSGSRFQVGDYLLELEGPGGAAEEDLELEEALDIEEEEEPTNPRIAQPPTPRGWLNQPSEAPDPVEMSVTPALGLELAAARGAPGFAPPPAALPTPAGPRGLPPGLPGLPPPVGGGFGAARAPSAPPLSPPLPVPAPPPAADSAAPPPARGAAPRPGQRPTPAPPPSSEAPASSPAAGAPWVARTHAYALAGGAAALSLGLVVLVATAQLLAASSALRDASLLRAEQLADSLGNRNAQALGEQRGAALDADFVKDREGVRSATVTDTHGTVLAPASRLRTSAAASAAWKEAQQSRKPARHDLRDGTWEVAVPIRADVGGTGAKQVVGYAIVVVNPEDTVGRLYAPGARVVAVLVAGLVAAAGLAAAAWALVVRPLQALREETELALRGDASAVSAPVRLPALEALAHSINRLVARARTRG